MCCILMTRISNFKTAVSAYTYIYQGCTKYYKEVRIDYSQLLIKKVDKTWMKIIMIQFKVCTLSLFISQF